MTIQEAIKSDKPFRRSGDRDWYILWYISSNILDKDIPYALGQEGKTFSEFGNRYPTLDDIMATDWEVKQ